MKVLTLAAAIFLLKQKHLPVSYIRYLFVDS
jgi:hypothetical protein